MKNIMGYQIIDAIDSSIYWKDLSGKYLGCNKYMANTVNMSRDEVIGKTDFLLPWKNHADKLRKFDLLVINDRKRYQIEESVVLENGAKKIFLSSKSPLLDKEKNIIGIIGVSIDITHQKRLIDEFTQTENSLNEYSDIKTRFLQNISHEARIPLGSVLSISESLKDNWHKFDDKTKFQNMELIFKEASRLSKFVLNTFDASNFSKNGIQLQLKKSNFSSFLKDTITKCQKSFCDTKVEIQMNQFSDYVFSFDPILISRVIENIMINAIEYSPKKKSITIGLYKTCLKNTEIPAIHCCFTDEGVGVPTAELKSIFNPFTESTRTMSKSSGVGLGLSICKEIIKAHLGDIWVENNPSKVGVTFNFTLPTNLLSTPNKFNNLDKKIEKKSTNIVRKQLTKTYCTYQKEPYALIGISPFNSYFSTEKILEICEWVNNQYDDFALFIPDEISKYTFEALGYTQTKTNQKIKKQDNYTVNKINKALSSFYKNNPKKSKIKLHTMSKLREYKSYQDLYSLYSKMFFTNEEFRNNCLEVTESVLLNRIDKNQVINDFQKNIAVQYFLFELPIMTHATNILQKDSCDYVYHSIPKFLKHLFLSKEIISPNQRYLVLS